MHHGELAACIPPQWASIDFEEWTSNLHSICGNFNPERMNRNNRVKGGAAVMNAGGLDVAQVANDLDLISRDERDIRHDQSDNLFLLLQLEGSCGIEQNGGQQRLDPGDCILVDSTRPSVFYFGGSFSNHLSVHMSRQLIISEKGPRLQTARKLEASDPMSTMLGAIVAKLMATDGADTGAPHLCDLLFNATRQAFASYRDDDLAYHSDSSVGRIEIVQVLIDENLTEDWLTPQWLADRIGVSLRTLQEDMSATGTTVTKLIKLRRLHLARERLRMLRRAPGGTIADVAYSVGFNDISYFNRSFRALFDCSPKDVVAR